jgi:hypothetical protein
MRISCNERKNAAGSISSHFVLIVVVFVFLGEKLTARIYYWSLVKQSKIRQNNRKTLFSIMDVFYFKVDKITFCLLSCFMDRISESKGKLMEVETSRSLRA